MEQTSRLSIVIDTGNAQRDLQNLRRALADLERSGSGTEQSLGDVGNSANNASRSLANGADNGTKLTRSLGMIKAAALGLAGIGLAGLGSQIVATQREFDALNAQLITATGSIENASVAFSQLQEFAKTTPYGLAQSVEGFAKLKNLGLEPSIESLTSFGNTASAMGKDLMQMIEAVADATTGEFERLKEFGIKSSKQGDQITFTFQGVKTTVKNNAKDIQKYLLDIGNVNFAGAMDARAKTLDGAIASLGDSWSALLLTMSQGGIGDALAEVVRGLDDILGGIASKLNDPAVIEGFKVTFGTISEMFNTIKTIIGEVITAIQNGTQFVLDNAEAFTALASGIGASATAFLAIKAGMAIFALFASGTATVTMLSTAIGVLTGVAGAFGAVMAVITSPITLAVVAIGALVAVSVYLYRNWDEVKAKTEEVWFAIGEIVAIAVENVKSYFGGIGEWFGGVWESVKTAISTKIDEIKQAFWQWLGGMPQPVQEMVANIVSIFHGLVSATQTIWAGMVAVSKLVSLAVIATWQGLTAIFASIWQGFVDIAKTAWDIVVSITKPIIDTLTNIVKTGLTVIVSVWQAQFTAIKLVAGVVFEGIKAVVGGGINAIKAIFTAGLTVFASVFNAGFGLIKNIFTTTFAVIKALVRGDMEGVKQAISNGIKNAWNIVKSGVTDIVGEFKGLGAKLKQVGMEAIQGLIEGIASKFDAVKRKVGEIANYIPSGMRKILDIHSPSRVMREIGAWAGEGFVLGVGDKIKDAKQVAQDLANALTNTITDLHRQHFMLKNHANPLADLDYKLQFGELAELTDVQKARVIELARANLDLAKANDINKSVSDEIARIDEKWQTHGMNRLEILQWQIINTEKYKGANENLLATLKNQIQVESELNQLFKAREKLKVYQDSLAKNTYLYRNKDDKYAGERWDLSQQGFDGKYIEQMIETLRQSDVMSAMANMPKTLTMPTLQNNNLGSAVSSAVTGYFDLKKQLDHNLAIIKEAENAKLITEQESQLARLEQERAFHEARQNLVMAGADNILGSMANTTKAMLGEQSSAYRAMFALQQSFAIGTAIVNIHKAISDAFAEGTTLAQKFAGVATATTQGMKIVSAIQQIRNPVIGQAHDGIMSVPKSGTWNLEKGERVLPKHTAKALDDKLASMGNGKAVNVIIHNHSNAQATVEQQPNGDVLVTIGNMAKYIARDEIQKYHHSQLRQGGIYYGR